MHPNLGEHLRPDKTGVVIQPLAHGGVLVHCDTRRPTAWRRPDIHVGLRHLAAAGFPVSIEAGARYWVMSGIGEWEAPISQVERLPNGMHLVKVPQEVVRKLRLWVRPECQTLDFSAVPRLPPWPVQQRRRTAMTKHIIMDKTGHSVREFDKADIVAVQEAERRFRALINKDYAAFAKNAKGEVTGRASKFDPDTDVVFMETIQEG